MTTDTLIHDVLFDRIKGHDGDIATITLNRPKALNALTKSMCIGIYEHLNDWAKDDSVKAVLISGEGEKAFCAGGDIRNIYDNGPDKAADSSAFFWHEYRMNHAIFHFPKPYIALMDGITMGGGCGVSMHGSHRVASEHLMLAMPETGIGFFPDVGGGYFLSRCPDYSGYYLGLTGNRIDCADALYTGFATHVVSREEMKPLVQALADTDFGDDANTAVDALLQSLAYDVPESALQKMAPVINDKFSKGSVKEVMQALAASDNEQSKDWCHRALGALQTKSPTSVLVTLDQLSRAKTMDFDAVMQMEFNMAYVFVQNHDFYEGVRAAIVDKDRNPKWRPETLEVVSQADITQYFQPGEITLTFD